MYISTAYPNHSHTTCFLQADLSSARTSSKACSNR